MFVCVCSNDDDDDDSGRWEKEPDYSLMELDILNRLGRGMSYSSIESVRRRSSMRCGLIFGTGPMVPDSSFEPVLEPDRVRWRSMPGSVSEVRNPRPCSFRLTLFVGGASQVGGGVERVNLLSRVTVRANDNGNQVRRK